MPTVRMLVPAATIDTLAYAKALIRNVPDFPRRGVLFKDITPLLADPKGFHIVLDALAERFIGEHVYAIVGNRVAFPRRQPRGALNASFSPVDWELPAVDRVSQDLEYAAPNSRCTSTASEGAKARGWTTCCHGRNRRLAELARLQGGYVSASCCRRARLSRRSRRLPPGPSCRSPVRASAKKRLSGARLAPGGRANPAARPLVRAEDR
jgi:adenine phosphoribosyltransferase